MSVRSLTVLHHPRLHMMLLSIRLTPSQLNLDHEKRVRSAGIKEASPTFYATLATRLLWNCLQRQLVVRLTKWSLLWQQICAYLYPSQSAKNCQWKDTVRFPQFKKYKKAVAAFLEQVEKESGANVGWPKQVYESDDTYGIRSDRNKTSIALGKMVAWPVLIICH